MHQVEGPDIAPAQQGDGVELPVVKARGAERHGVIWILVLSLGGAALFMAGLWLANLSHFSHAPLLHS